MVHRPSTPAVVLVTACPSRRNWIISPGAPEPCTITAFPVSMLPTVNPASTGGATVAVALGAACLLATQSVFQSESVQVCLLALPSAPG